MAQTKKKNTRDVQFEVEDLSKKVKAWVKIEWAELNYFHDYYVDISIDKDSAEKLAGARNRPAMRIRRRMGIRAGRSGPAGFR